MTPREQALIRFAYATTELLEDTMPHAWNEALCKEIASEAIKLGVGKLRGDEDRGGRCFSGVWPDEWAARERQVLAATLGIEP